MRKPDTITIDPLTIGLISAAITCASTGHLVAGIILAALCGTFTFPITWRKR